MTTIYLSKLALEGSKELVSVYTRRPLKEGSVALFQFADTGTPEGLLVSSVEELVFDDPEDLGF